MQAHLILSMVFAVSLLVPTAAEARDLSKYPCTVFANGLCFRLSPDTEVTYSLPIDVEQYSVTKKGESLMTISIGGSRIRQSDGLGASRIELSGWQITGTKRDNAGPIVILITHPRRRESTIEISIQSTAPVNAEIRSILSSMRPCEPIRSGGQKCPVNVKFGASLIEAADE